MKKWIAFFSKSGSEIVELRNRLGRWPDLIITNRNNLNGCNPKIIELVQYFPETVVFIKNDPSEMDYVHAISSVTLSGNLFVTLHGYMRILPKKICEMYEIYNGHPGLITKYPELKGKDPQKKAWLNALKTSGCVIHKVTKDVDDGEILAEVEVPIGGTLDDTISVLHKNSIDLWDKFLSKKLEPKEINAAMPTDYREQDYSVGYCEEHYPETLKELRRLQEEEFLLFCKKQFDYGPGNISVGQDTAAADGKRVSLCSIIFRCNDKVQRLLNLVVKNSKSAQNEPVMDAFSDLSLYGKIAKIVDKGVWGK